MTDISKTLGGKVVDADARRIIIDAPDGLRYYIEFDYQLGRLKAVMSP